MNTLEFGQKRPNSGGSKFLRVKNQGDTIKFRIANNPVYTGKHFLKNDDGSFASPIDCPRINSGEKCELCEKFFSIKADQKKAKEIGDAANEKLFGNEARKYSVAVMYYFPVLLRKTTMADWQDKVGKFVILQTTEGIRNRINEQYEAEVKIFQRDFVLKNTGSDIPKDYYAFSVVDSADTEELTPSEKEELKKAQEFDMSTINDGGNNADEVGDVEIPEEEEPAGTKKVTPEIAEKIMNSPVKEAEPPIDPEDIPF